MNSWHVGVAAEALAAAQFARYTYDVSVQYGANQPEYDLIAVSGDKILKISVKGSQDGSWGLTQSFKKGRTYHEAIQDILYEHHEWGPTAKAYGTVDKLPESWRFTKERAEEIFEKHGR